MNSNIIVIGPIRSGKSSICKKLSEKLNKNHVDMDDQRANLYPKLGYSDELAEKEYKSKGIEGWYLYQKPFELNAVKNIMRNNKNAVIEFGGGQSVYEDETQVKEFISLMSGEKHIFLLLPCIDKNRAIEILDKRIGDEDAEKILNRIFINSYTNTQVANYIIYTEGKTPDETIEEIISIYNSSN